MAGLPAPPPESFVERAETDRAEADQRMQMEAERAQAELDVLNSGRNEPA
jgi:hypothetical protein